MPRRPARHSTPAQKAFRKTQFLNAQRSAQLAAVAGVIVIMPRDWSTFTAARRRGYLSGIAVTFDAYTAGARRG